MRAYHRWSSQWSRHWSNSASQSSASQPPACSARLPAPYTCSEIAARNGLHYLRCSQGSKVSMVLFSSDQDREGYYTTGIPDKKKQNKSAITVKHNIMAYGNNLLCFFFYYYYLLLRGKKIHPEQHANETLESTCDHY